MSMSADGPFLHRRCVVFTGRLASMSRTEATRCVWAQGGSVRLRVSRNTDLLVIGSDGWPLSASGRLTKNLLRAEHLQQAGHRLEVLPEAVFLRRLGQFDEVGIRRLHTLEQLSRMLGISGLRLRRWVKDGLLQAAEVEGSVMRFDFAEVTAARTLAQFLRKRRSLSTILSSLERLRRWLPDDGRIADHLLRLRGAMVIRDADGRIVDPAGQYLFAFDPPAATDHHAAVAWPNPPQTVTESSTEFSRTDRQAEPAAERLFDRAFRLQQQGDNAVAIDLYRQWLRRYGSDADVLFNLGTAYMERGQHELAIKALRRCVRCQPYHERGWNNLGLSLAQVGRLGSALLAISKSLDLDPDYADACYNLADLLDEAGRPAEARLLWLRYLSHRQTGQWSVYARQRVDAGSLPIDSGRN